MHCDLENRIERAKRLVVVKLIGSNEITFDNLINYIVRDLTPVIVNVAVKTPLFESRANLKVRMELEKPLSPWALVELR